MTMSSPRWVTTEAAATLLSTSPAVVRHMLRTGALEGVKLGRSWRVDLWAIGTRKEAKDGRDG